nr:unnamed protein product [Callosobruchus analis]
MPSRGKRILMMLAEKSSSEATNITISSSIPIREAIQNPLLEAINHEVIFEDDVMLSSQSILSSPEAPSLESHKENSQIFIDKKSLEFLQDVSDINSLDTQENYTVAGEDRLPTPRWCYVLSSENPADCASRGLFPSQFLCTEIWINGPAWLTENQDAWPNASFLESSAPQALTEEKALSMSTFVDTSSSGYVLATIHCVQPKRLWVKNWNLRRNELGPSNCLLKEMALEDPKENFLALRMSIRII